MRIVLDLQACQTEGSRNRGIGRYSIALAEAMLRRGGHEFFVVLNGAFPEAAAAVRERLRDLLPADRIRTYDIVEGEGEPFAPGSWRGEASLRLRDDFIAALRPNVVHVTSLFEGLGDLSVTDIPPRATESCALSRCTTSSPISIPILICSRPTSAAGITSGSSP